MVNLSGADHSWSDLNSDTPHEACFLLSPHREAMTIYLVRFNFNLMYSIMPYLGRSGRRELDRRVT